MRTSYAHGPKPQKFPPPVGKNWEGITQMAMPVSAPRHPAISGVIPLYPAVRYPEDSHAMPPPPPPGGARLTQAKLARPRSAPWCFRAPTASARQRRPRLPTWSHRSCRQSCEGKTWRQLTGRWRGCVGKRRGKEGCESRRDRAYGQPAPTSVASVVAAGTAEGMVAACTAGQHDALKAARE